MRIRDEFGFNHEQPQVFAAIEFQHLCRHALFTVRADRRSFSLPSPAFPFRPYRIRPANDIAGYEFRTRLDPVRRFRSQLFPNPQLRYSCPTLADAGACRNPVRFQVMVKVQITGAIR